MSQMIVKRTTLEADGSIGRLGFAVRKFFVAFIRRMNERAAAAELYSFDDYQLRDIGISRCEIEGKVRAGHGDR